MLRGKYRFIRSTNQLLGYNIESQINFEKDGSYEIRERLRSGNWKIIGKGIFSDDGNRVSFSSENGVVIYEYSISKKFLELSEIKHNIVLRRIR